MILVAVYHLLSVVVVVAVAADIFPITDPVAASGNGAGDWCGNLPLDPDSCQHLRRIGDGTVARPNHPVPVSACDSHAMFMALGCVTDTGSRHPTQDALRPG